MSGIMQMLLASGSTFKLTISSNQTNANLRSLALAAGWDGLSKVVATISSGIYIDSNSTGTPALTVGGSFPGGVELTNNGFIVGMGGAGGAGGSYTQPRTGGPGLAAGPALSVSSMVSINNQGTIAGGGGGGGGGAGGTNTLYNGNGGGGGRTGNTNSAGGAGVFGGASGSVGTLSGPGVGGATASRGVGGTGGAWGAAGSKGGDYAPGDYGGFGGPGGSAGAAVSGNSNITWLATGTRLGAIA